jgi:hypothetical protein
MGTSTLRKLQINEASTLNRFKTEVATGVTEQYKPAANRFHDKFATSAAFYAQSAKTSQYETNGKRKYGPNCAGGMYPTTMQAETVRFVRNAGCAGTWSIIKNRWCACKVGALDWSAPHGTLTERNNAQAKLDHCCVTVQNLADFIAECLNAGLEDKISTEFTYAALSHWLFSCFPPDPSASFAKDLPEHYLRIAPLQGRHRHCHNLITNRTGHPDVGLMPPPECVVGMTLAQLAEHMTDTPAKHTRSRDVEPVIAEGSPASRTRQHDVAFGKNQAESGGSGVSVPAKGKTPMYKPRRLYDIFERTAREGTSSSRVQQGAARHDQITIDSSDDDFE